MDDKDLPLYRALWPHQDTQLLDPLTTAFTCRLNGTDTRAHGQLGPLFPLPTQMTTQTL